MLLLSVVSCFSMERLRKVYEETLLKLEELKLKDEVKNVAITTDKLLQPSEFKISRKKIAKRYETGKLFLVDLQNSSKQEELLLSALEQELCACFAQVLQKDEKEIGLADDFFTDLGGSSLDYFALIDTVKEHFGTEIAVSEDRKMSSVREFYEYLKT